MPEFSIVMPAYNAAKYIEEAINSVLRQTFADWELIIVDDCSTDNTLSIVQRFASSDNRIQYSSLTDNSGSVFIPRAQAVSRATGRRIVNLDADDYLEDTYLEKIYKRYQETQADAILGRLYCLRNNIITDTIPRMDFDMGQVVSGEQACMFTIPRWVIGLSGAIPKDIYLSVLQQQSAHTVLLYAADEVLSRRLLLKCRNIAFVDAQYIYRYNENSVTHKFTLKQFDRLSTDRLLLALLEDHFGKDSMEVQMMHQQMFETVLFCEILYLKNQHLIDKKAKKTIIDKLKEGYSTINWDYCKGKVPQVYLSISQLGFRIMMSAVAGYVCAKRFKQLFNHS